MSKPDEPHLIAPPFVHACRVLDHLFMAANALSHCKTRKADRLWHEVEEIRRRFGNEVLPAILRKETLG